MSVKKIFPLIVTLFLGASCMHSIHQVHVSDFDPYGSFESGKIVKAKTEQFVIMGFVTESNYVDKAYRDLQAKCKDGRIQGITTQYITSLGFFSWTNKILMQGLCLS
jgi:hypothetical protein